MDIFRLNGVIKDYAWGNDWFLPSLLGIEQNGPMGEYWMGTHKSGEAKSQDGRKLSEIIASDKEHMMGRYADKYQSFPLLFKVLAIASPLSLQTHPNKEQAKEGWAREAELRASGKGYNYQDDNEKAEIIMALSPVSAMCGFRELDDIRKNFEKYIPQSVMQYFAGNIADIREMFFGLYALSQEQKDEMLEEYAKNLAKDPTPEMEGEFLTWKGIAERCLDLYPGDVGALAPIFMNVAHLEKGEALYLEPDTLHAYTLGNGIELMTASDNVLRGGLTHKRVDLNELGRIMKFDTTHVEKVHTHKDKAGRIVAETPSPDFTLLRIESGEYTGLKEEVGIVIVTDGAAEFTENGETLTLGKGEVAFVPFSADYKLEVKGEAYMARIPE